MTKIKSFLPILVFFILASTLMAQDLGEAARKERERQAAIKQKVRVYTNADIATSHPEDKPSTVASEKPQKTKKSKQKTAAESSTADNPAEVDQDGHDEKYWSEKFIAAKKRVSDLEKQQTELQDRIKDYSLKLQLQSDVYDREHLYIPLIEQAKQNLEKNKNEQADAKTALDDLYTALRKAGGPPSWADSKLAEQETPPEHPDLEYFTKKLKELEDQYDEMERPYKVERFRLIHRREPEKNDSLNMRQENYGPGLDPSIATLDSKINELEKKRQAARERLILQARRAGVDIQ